MNLRGATDSDRGAIAALLLQESLPTADLEYLRISDFIIAEVDGRATACIGAEVFNERALLRSLVVSSGRRGDGVAAKLITALESTLCERGVDEIWLLTIDADAYFERHGYLVRSRDQVPRDIAGTREYSGLCPGSAILMSKSIRNP